MNNKDKIGKRLRMATTAATRQQGNEGLRIFDEGSNTLLNSPSDIETSPHSSTLNVENSKKKRGPSKPKMVCTSMGEAKIELQFNERGQVVGPNSAKFASNLGILAQEHVPIVIADWGDVDLKLRDGLWQIVKQNYNVDECRKDISLHMMSTYWRKFKYKISKQIFEAVESGEMPHRLSHIKPYNIKSNEEWDAFIKERLSPKFKAKREKYKLMRKKQAIVHTMSRKGYACLEHEMKITKSSTSSVISRVNVWTRGHLRKNGEPINEAVSDTMEIIKEYTKTHSSQQVGDNIREDALSRVLGPERRGWVWGLGLGATPSRIDAQIHSSGRTKQLEQTVQKLQRQVDNMNAMLLKQSQQDHNSNSEDVMDMNSTIPQGSRHVSGHDHMNARCQLLQWDSPEKVVVAEGKIALTDPNTKVHHCHLGPSCWKVWVDQVFYHKLPIFRTTQEMLVLEDAIGSTVAWPIHYVKLL